MTEVVVIGAGVAGLSAAWHAARRDPDVRVTVVEASARAGGLVETERTADGFVLEHGPDSLMRTKPVAMHVVNELGLEGDLVGPGERKRSYLLDDADALRALPDGIFSASPAAAWALVRSPIVSTSGKLRFLLEPIVPARKDDAEESVDAFFRRRFGAELAERVVEPLLGGIYGSSTRELGMLSVMPHLAAMERRAGSVTRASLSAPARTKGSTGSPLVTLEAGMEQLPAALLAASGATLFTGAPVRGLARRGSRWRLTFEDGGVMDADAVVVAVPAWSAARIVEGVDAGLAAELGDIEHAPLAAVHLAWRGEDVLHAMNGTGFVVSPRSRRAISACTWSSRKYRARAPEGAVLVRAFLRDPSASDEDAIAAAREDLRELMGIDAAPILTRVRRRARALPRVAVGHRARVERMAARASALPRFALAGNAHGGVGVPECIESGARAAASVLASA